MPVCLHACVRAHVNACTLQFNRAIAHALLPRHLPRHLCSNSPVPAFYLSVLTFERQLTNLRLHRTPHNRDSEADSTMLLIYPAAFNWALGPLHLDLLARSRALDTQCFLIAACPANDPNSNAPFHRFPLSRKTKCDSSKSSRTRSRGQLCSVRDAV